MKRDRQPGRALLAALAAAPAFSCAILEPPPALAPPPDLLLRDVTLIQFKGSTLTARATAAEVQYTRDTGHLEGRAGSVSPVAGSLAGGVLQAGLAVGSTRSGVAALSEGVHWASASGDLVDTSASKVDLASQVASGEEPVSLRGSGYRIEAGSFQSHYGSEGDFQFGSGVHVLMAESSVSDLSNPPEAGAADLGEHGAP